MSNEPIGTTWNLAQRLKFARAGAGLDQAQLAEMIGTSRPTVSGYERGVAEPPASVFVRWANATGVTLDWLAAGVETEKASTPKGGGQSYAFTGSNRGPADYGSNPHSIVEFSTASVPDYVPGWMLESASI